MYSGSLAVEPEYTSPDWVGAWWLGKKCPNWGNKITSGDSNRRRLLGIEAYALGPCVSFASEFKPTLEVPALVWRRNLNLRLRVLR